MKSPHDSAASLPAAAPFSRAKTGVTHPFVSGRKIVDAAQALAIEFGTDAGMAASLRAARSRAQDNAVTFCHWREVERLVDWMAQTDGGAHMAAATRH